MISPILANINYYIGGKTGAEFKDSMNYIENPKFPIEIKLALLQKEREEKRISLDIEREKRQAEREEQREKRQVEREEQREERQMQLEEKREERQMQREDRRDNKMILFGMISVFLVAGSLSFLGICLQNGLLGSPAQSSAKSLANIASSVSNSALLIIGSGAVATFKRIVQLCQYFGIKFCKI
jgi:uncharacterized membrane protein YdbT with pleckstrin-like domain